MDDSKRQQPDSSPADESNLWERLRQGDSTVLRQLLKAYLIPLRRYAEGVLGGTGDPQEAVQEAFIRLWTHRESWRGNGSIRSLLYTITRNAALDELRKQRRKVPFPEGHPSRLPGRTIDPLDRLLEAELREAAARALSRLPPRRGEIFRLVREEGLSYKEVADVLNISPQTVANLMSMALRDLRKALGPALRGEEGAVDQPAGHAPSRQVSGSD